jgi:hypothetical protein
MTGPSPCQAYRDQLKNGRHYSPHSDLRYVDTRPFRGSMFGGGEEATYQRAVCGSVTEHINDKNECAPWWWLACTEKK